MARPAHPSPDQQFTKPDRNSLSLRTYLERVTELLVRASDSGSRSLLQDVVNTYFAYNWDINRQLIPSVSTAYASDQRSYVDNVIDFAETYGFRLQPTNVSALVDESRGTASVYATILARGTPEATAAITNEDVLVYHFERRIRENQDDEEWLVVRMEFMRGPGLYYMMGP